VRLAANKIYKPSYISLQYALAFYGMIPETVVQLTCVTSLKTASFENGWGQFVYQNLKPSLFFGYAPYPIEHPSANGQYFLMATPEKALLDFLYLNSFYKTQEDFESLRLDEDFMTDSLDRERLGGYLKKFASKALNRRVKDLLRLYG
jgi:predicted transcriptional regulator of viral defense system